MDYQTFFGTVKDCLQAELGEGYLVDVVDLQKNNQPGYKGLTVLRQPTGGVSYGRVLEVKPVYQEYINGKSVEECARMLRSIYENDGDGADMVNIAGITACWESAKDYVYLMLVPKEGNGDFLGTVPHRPYLDLAICYYAEVELNGINAKTWVTNTLAGLWGIKEEDIYKQASQNMGRDGYELISIQELLEEMRGCGIEEKNRMEPPIYVMTNKRRRFGAAAILDGNFLEDCSLKLNGSFYLLPSSIHEMIAVPYDGQITPRELQTMVMEINEAVVAPGEQLGDTVYYYGRDSDGIQIAGQRADMLLAG